MTISSRFDQDDRALAVEPALDDLAKKQDDLFDRLEHGFADRRDVLLWAHDCSLRTLGQLPDDWFADLFATRYRLTALLKDSDQRAEASSAVATEGRAATERAILADDSLVEGCRAGMSVLADQAAEYTNINEAPVDATNQSYLAMRPALDDLAHKQRDVLERALGFASPRIESRADVREWSRDVIRATKGADDGFASRVLWSPYLLDALRGDPTSATLHLFLAEQLLGPMNAQIRETTTAATEQADENRATHGSFDT